MQTLKLGYTIQARWIRSVFGLLNSASSAVKYEAATSLTSLTQNPAAVKGKFFSAMSLCSGGTLTAFPFDVFSRCWCLCRTARQRSRQQRQAHRPRPNRRSPRKVPSCPGWSRHGHPEGLDEPRHGGQAKRTRYRSRDDYQPERRRGCPFPEKTAANHFGARL
jgi:hypothetical protein